MENIFSTNTEDNVPLCCIELCLQIHCRYNCKELTCTRPISVPGIPYASFLGILVRIYILSTVILINASLNSIYRPSTQL